MLYLSTGNIRIDFWLLSIPIHTNCIVNEMVSTGDTEISLHIRAETRVGGLLQANSNPKCQDLPKFSFSGEGVLLQTNIPEILEWGYSRDFEHKSIPLELATASQIVSHILRMWRLITKRRGQWSVSSSEFTLCGVWITCTCTNIPTPRLSNLTECLSDNLLLHWIRTLTLSLHFLCHMTIMKCIVFTSRWCITHKTLLVSKVLWCT